MEVNKIRFELIYTDEVCDQGRQLIQFKKQSLSKPELENFIQQKQIYFFKGQNLPMVDQMNQSLDKEAGDNLYRNFTSPNQTDIVQIPKNEQGSKPKSQKASDTSISASNQQLCLVKFEEKLTPEAKRNLFKRSISSPNLLLQKCQIKDEVLTKTFQNLEIVKENSYLSKDISQLSVNNYSQEEILQFNKICISQRKLNLDERLVTLISPFSIIKISSKSTNQQNQKKQPEVNPNKQQLAFRYLQRLASQLMPARASDIQSDSTLIYPICQNKKDNFSTENYNLPEIKNNSNVNQILIQETIKSDLKTQISEQDLQQIAINLQQVKLPTRNRSQFKDLMVDDGTDYFPLVASYSLKKDLVYKPPRRDDFLSKDTPSVNNINGIPHDVLLKEQKKHTQVDYELNQFQTILHKISNVQILSQRTSMIQQSLTPTKPLRQQVKEFIRNRSSNQKHFD